MTVNLTSKRSSLSGFALSCFAALAAASKLAEGMFRMFEVKLSSRDVLCGVVE